MDLLKRIVDDVVWCAQLSDEYARSLIGALEGEVERCLLLGEIKQDEAWDLFFCLLHECDARNLTEDRARIVSKIDTKVYDPFLSRHPGIRFIAQLRARILGLVRSEYN